MALLVSFAALFFIAVNFHALFKKIAFDLNVGLKNLQTALLAVCACTLRRRAPCLIRWVSVRTRTTKAPRLQLPTTPREGFCRGLRRRPRPQKPRHSACRRARRRQRWRRAVAKLGSCGSSEEHLQRAQEAELCISECGALDKVVCFQPAGKGTERGLLTPKMD